VREAATICPRPYKLIFHLLTLKVVFESPVTRATSVPILVFLGLSVLDLGLMYAIDRQRGIVLLCVLIIVYDALCASRLSWLRYIFAILCYIS